MSQFTNMGLDKFFMLPKKLFENGCKLSLEAKILFTLILDRANLSFINDWRDKEGHLYIYYTIEDAQSMLGCGKSKAVKVFQELEENRYISRKKQGLGKPSMVYLNYRKFDCEDSEEDRKSRLEVIHEFYRSFGLETPESLK